MADAITTPIVVVSEERLEHFHLKFTAWADGKFQVKSTAFDGSYESLTNLPTLDGTEIKGTLTKEGLNIAARDWVQALGYQTATQVQNLINAAISGLYTPKGNITFAELPQTLTAAELGYVYNVTDGGTTDARFVDGANKPLAAGANVAVVEVESGVYKYDVLGAIVDLTNYVTTSAMQEYVSQQLASYVTNDGLTTKLASYLLKTDVQEITEAAIDAWFD